MAVAGELSPRVTEGLSLPIRGGTRLPRILSTGEEQVDAGLACLNRQRRQEFSGEFRKTGEISRFYLWRLISCSIRWQQVGPGTAR